LLSPTHPGGNSKARFFARFGFSADKPNILMEALRKHAYNDYAKREETYFGTRYVIEAPLLAPDNRKPLIRTVWFIENDEKMPLFVTAYPV
jgi:hypothetical protein